MITKCCKCGHRTRLLTCPKCQHSVCTSCKPEVRITKKEAARVPPWKPPEPLQEGPRIQRTTRQVCNGCKYLETKLRSRSVPGGTTDYFNCKHPDVGICMPTVIVVHGGTKRVLRPRNIGYGLGSVQTPSWCPFIKKGDSKCQQ